VNTRKTHSILLEFEADGTFVVADAEGDSKTGMPQFTYRIKMDTFPTDEAIFEHISRLFGAPCVLVETLDRNIELDSSALSGLKKMPVDIFDNVYLDEVKNEALVLVVDIRNFSNFLCHNPEEKVFSLIKDFTSNFLSCVNQFGFGCSYYKLMGDGAIIIWDSTNAQSVFEALQVFDTYIEFLNEELLKPYPGLALAGSLVTDKVFKYEISAEASQLKYRDYVGYGINLACRIQNLAHANQLILNHKLACTGLIPYETVRTPLLLEEIQTLKGLKEEDCDELLFYKPER
jgi:hypothetical protein